VPPGCFQEDFSHRRAFSLLEIIRKFAELTQASFSMRYAIDAKYFAGSCKKTCYRRAAGG